MSELLAETGGGVMADARRAIRDAWEEKRHLWRDGEVFRVVGPMRFAPAISPDDGIKPTNAKHDIIEFRRTVERVDFDAVRVCVTGSYDGVERVVVDQILRR